MSAEDNEGPILDMTGVPKAATKKVHRPFCQGGTCSCPTAFELGGVWYVTVLADDGEEIDITEADYLRTHRGLH